MEFGSTDHMCGLWTCTEWKMGTRRIIKNRFCMYSLHSVHT